MIVTYQILISLFSRSSVWLNHSEMITFFNLQWSWPYPSPGWCSTCCSTSHSFVGSFMILSWVRALIFSFVHLHPIVGWACWSYIFSYQSTPTDFYPFGSGPQPVSGRSLGSLFTYRAFSYQIPLLPTSVSYPFSWLSSPDKYPSVACT